MSHGLGRPNAKLGQYFEVVYLVQLLQQTGFDF